MNKWTEIALKTWYSKDDPKHLDPLHPAMGLAGESGELIDVYKKHLYKPGYDAWDCKLCGNNKDHHEVYHEDHNHTPIVLDELGDLTYYARILFYQSACDLPEPYSFDVKIKDILIGINLAAARILVNVNASKGIDIIHLRSVWRHIHLLCQAIDTPLENILEMNKVKLLGSSDNHGWKDAV